MLGYYLRLALRSMRRTPVITALMVAAIGLGIGASMTMITVLHVMSEDPLPDRSDVLYYPHVDPLPASYPPGQGGYEASANFTWPDAMALLQAHRADRQAVMVGGYLLIHPARSDLAPFYVRGHYATADFFPMFGVPFLQGSSWSAADDATRARVVILNQELAGKLFGDTAAVGKTVNLGEAAFRVIGVTAWAPRPRFYSDDVRGMFDSADQFYLPFFTAMDLKLAVSGNESGWGHDRSDDRTSPTTTWMQIWVELDDPAKAAAYRQFLYDYSADQKKRGRFQRPPENARLYGMMAWLKHRNLVPEDVELQFWLALAFLAVCIVNVVCLLLAKFLRRSNEISVRRALGARQRDIFLQLCVEAALIGLTGGILGLALAQLGLWSVRQRSVGYAHMAQMDPSMLLGTFLLAVLASVGAGILPAWRACHVPPATLLKSQ